MEVGNTPPSLSLGLPPPIVISGEVAVDVSSEYEEVNTHTPKAWASFLKDKSASLLHGATVQTYFGPVNTSTTQQEEDFDDGIVCVGTLSVSVDLLPSFKSGFQVGFKGYDQVTKDVSSRVRTIFQSLSPLSKLKSMDYVNDHEGILDIGHPPPRALKKHCIFDWLFSTLSPVKRLGQTSVTQSSTASNLLITLLLFLASFVFIVYQVFSFRSSFGGNEAALKQRKNKLDSKSKHTITNHRFIWVLILISSSFVVGLGGEDFIESPTSPDVSPASTLLSESTQGIRRTKARKRSKSKGKKSKKKHKALKISSSNDHEMCSMEMFEGDDWYYFGGCDGNDYYVSITFDPFTELWTFQEKSVQENPVRQTLHIVVIAFPIRPYILISL